MSRRGPKGFPPQVTWCRSTRHRSSLVSGITSRIEEKLEGTIVKKCSWSDLAEGTSQYEPMVHAHATKWDEPAPRAKPVKRSRESAWDEEDEQQVRSKKPSSSWDGPKTSGRCSNPPSSPRPRGREPGNVNVVRVCVKASPAESGRRLHTNGLGVWDSGFGVRGLGFGVWGLRFGEREG